MKIDGIEAGTIRASAVLGVGVLAVAAFFGMATPLSALAACPNDEFRTGPSAQLPDCRAYELVTPPNSNGRIFGDFATGPGGHDSFAVEAWNAAGQSLVFATRGSSLSEPEGGVGGWNPGWSPDLYEAVRGSAGWQTVRHLTPHADESMFPFQGGFSADHQYIFTHTGLIPKTPGTFGSLYKGTDAGYLGDPAGNFELIGVGSLGSEKLAQGRYISPGGDHVIFSTGKTTAGSYWCEISLIAGKPCPVKQLEPNAPPTGTGAVYDRAADGPTQVVSLLPGNIPPGSGKDAAYQGASADGTIVAFKIEGKLFVRVNNERTEEVAPSGTTFGGLSADGTYLVYLAGGDIHRFDTVTTNDVEINSSADAKMVNVSTDGSHVYFISGSQLDGSAGVLGEPNMYVWGAGAINYIATVASSDTEGEPALTNWAKAVSPSTAAGNIGPGTDSSLTTPDGTVLVFESRKQLTGYPNAGHNEIYRYEGEDLQCVSCNPDAGSATADARLRNRLDSHTPDTVYNLSSDGKRVFFETAEPLVEADVDEINDIYEWQESPTAGSPMLALISSGTSVKYPLPPETFGEGLDPNSLLAVSSDGNDVFFLSQDALVAGAGGGGTPALYDARVGGGLPAPATSEPCDSAGACRPAQAAAPTLSSPVTGGGGGNLKPRRHCTRRKQHHGAGRKHRSCRRHGKKR